MNQKINSISPMFLLFAPVICIIACLYPCDLLLAQGTGYTGAYSCSLTGTSAHNTSGEIIYDDNVSNWFSPPGFNGGGNCGRKYMFTEYTGSAANIQLTFAYNGYPPEQYTTPPCASHDIYFYNYGTN